jgi:hypothetical protein
MLIGLTPSSTELWIETKEKQSLVREIYFLASLIGTNSPCEEPGLGRGTAGGQGRYVKAQLVA